MRVRGFMMVDVTFLDAVHLPSAKDPASGTALTVRTALSFPTQKLHHPAARQRSAALTDCVDVCA